ncbi:MAG: MotA/TolQ/ExbB proton channel family protein [Myxococcales bacterium]|nr:MotA/TolQ/ExbB proton channel family protein [Myxococcales bacterium]
MEFAASDFWSHLGLPARLIICVLLGSALLAIGIVVERIFTLGASRRQSLGFARWLAELLEQGDVDKAAAARAPERPGHLGRVLQTAFEVYRDCPREDPELTFESVARGLERQAQREVHRMKKGLGTLATIASIAPFLGLLGTVVGIVDSFVSMAKSGSGGLAVVSAGIAEALATTAIGLVIAIPVMAAYNALAEWTDSRAVDIAEASNELLDLLARHLRRPATEPASVAPLAASEG